MGRAQWDLTDYEGAQETWERIRANDPDDIAALVMFLSSAAAANINGQVIAIDGAAHINIGMDRYMLEFFSRQDSEV